MTELNKNKTYYRKNSPEVTRNLWKSLDKSDYQRNKRQFIQQLFIDNMSKFKSEEELKTVINNAFDEKLVVEEVVPKLGYRLIPSFDRKDFFSGDVSKDKTKDWYCFVCHSCGPNQDLIPCLTCFRSYHKRCLESNSDSKIESNTNTELLIGFDSDFRCDYCLRFTYPLKKNSVVDQLCGQQLNRLIETFLKSLENSLVDVNIYEEYRIESDLSSYALLFYPLNLDIIRLKAFKLKNYQSFVEFESDLKHFCHNFCVVRDQNQIQLFSDCIDCELNQLNECLDCYLGSRVTGEQQIPPDEWFTRVCRSPHDLVFAKYDRYPYWPSKVIKYDSNKVLVQFFEPKKFSKALVPNNKIRDIGYHFDSKQLTSNQILSSMALLYKYLKNLQNESSSLNGIPIYENAFRRIESLLAIKWKKEKSPVLADLNLEINRSVENLSNSCLKRKNNSNNDFNDINSLRIDNSSQSSNKNEKIKDSVFRKSNTALGRVLCDSEVTAEHKMQICSLILRWYSKK